MSPVDWKLIESLKSFTEKVKEFNAYKGDTLVFEKIDAETQKVVGKGIVRPGAYNIDLNESIEAFKRHHIVPKDMSATEAAKKLMSLSRDGQGVNGTILTKKVRELSSRIRAYKDKNLLQTGFPQRYVDVAKEYSFVQGQLKNQLKLMEDNKILSVDNEGAKALQERMRRINNSFNTTWRDLHAEKDELAGQVTNDVSKRRIQDEVRLRRDLVAMKELVSDLKEQTSLSNDMKANAAKLSKLPIETAQEYIEDAKELADMVKSGDFIGSMKKFKGFKRKVGKLKRPKKLAGMTKGLRMLGKVFKIAMVLEIVLKVVKALLTGFSKMRDMSAAFKGDFTKAHSLAEQGIDLNVNVSPSSLSSHFGRIHRMVDSFGADSGTFIDRKDIFAVTSAITQAGVKSDEIYQSAEAFGDVMSTAIYYSTQAGMAMTEVGRIMGDWRANMMWNFKTVNILLGEFAESAEEQGIHFSQLNLDFQNLNGDFSVWEAGLMGLIGIQKEVMSSSAEPFAAAKNAWSAVSQYVGKDMSNAAFMRIVQNLPDHAIQEAIEKDTEYLQKRLKETADPDQKKRLEFRISALQGATNSQQKATKAEILRGSGDPAQTMALFAKGIKAEFGDILDMQHSAILSQPEILYHLKNYFEMNDSTNTEFLTFWEGVTEVAKQANTIDVDDIRDKMAKAEEEYAHIKGVQADNSKNAKKQMVSSKEKMESLLRKYMSGIIASFDSIISMFRSLPDLIKGNNAGPTNLESQQKYLSQIYDLAAKMGSTEGGFDDESSVSQLQSLIDKYAGVGGNAPALKDDLMQRGLPEVSIGKLTFPEPSSALAQADAPNVTWQAAAEGNFTRTGEAGRKITGITLHHTAGGYGHFFRANKDKTSAHYVVKRDGSVLQLVKDKDIAHHAKGGNANTIGIEHESKYIGKEPFAQGQNKLTNWSKLTPEQENASRQLVLYLANKYKIGMGGIIGHTDHYGGGGKGTMCPANLFADYGGLEGWKQKRLVSNTPAIPKVKHVDHSKNDHAGAGQPSKLSKATPKKKDKNKKPAPVSKRVETQPTQLKQTIANEVK